MLWWGLDSYWYPIFSSVLDMIVFMYPQLSRFDRLIASPVALKAGIYRSLLNRNEQLSSLGIHGIALDTST
jgi:hypothetical protein